MNRLLHLFIPLLTSFLVPALSAQDWFFPYRAGYTFPSGTAWSASVTLPSCSVLDLGAGNIPLAVNDRGTVLYRDAEGRLVRWQWGREVVLAAEHPLDIPTFLNERGTALTVRTDEFYMPTVLYWPSGDSQPTALPWGSATIAPPYNAVPYALNDRDQLALGTDANNNLFMLFPSIDESETNLVSLGGGSWEQWSRYTSEVREDFSMYRGGVRYTVHDLNNHGASVGSVYEDSAYAGPWDPEMTYTYQNQYHAHNLTTVLDFEPWQISDTGTILGCTPAPVSGMVILDQFGERNLGPALAELQTGTPLMSNPDDGLEEIVVGHHYWKRMSERNLEAQATGNPSPDFWQGTISDLIREPVSWNAIEATCISANGRIAGTGWRFDPQTSQLEKHGFLLFPAILTPDWNRDGIIDTSDRRHGAAGLPWRFWINDDDDDGELSRSAADDLPGSSLPDHASPEMDGLRDGVDFFPLHLELAGPLQALDDLSQVEIRLSQADGAVNFICTSLRPTEVGQIHDTFLESGFGEGLAEPFGTCATVPVPAGGVALPADFLAWIRDHNGGILLLEGCRASTEPLVVEMYHEGKLILSSSLALSISPVRDMIRIINLRQADPKFASADPGPWLTSTDNPPNLPDSYLEQFDLPLRTLVHVHGFNWGGDEIPAAHSELFKRFYQSGSNARFVGVTWYGDQGTLALTGSSITYNENVINAFITAPYLAEVLEPWSGNGSFLLAHSLGNMLAASAIVDHGLRFDRYFLLNAAVPVEAYDGEVPDRRLMVHPQWKDEPGDIPDYAEFLHSANWHRLFPPEDHRSRLGWKDRFDRLPELVACTQYFSTGEDVLRSGNGDLPALFQDVADQERVWVYNEMIKGTTEPTAPLSTDVHGGWGFNRSYMTWDDPGGAAHPPPGSWVPRPPSSANYLPSDGLVVEPFFRPFSSGDGDFPTWEDGQWLYGSMESANSHLPPSSPSPGDLDRIRNHAKVLAEAIPGHSAPAGCRAIGQLSLLDNINLDIEFRDPHLWPQRDAVEKRDRWLHSDYLKPSFCQVVGLYRHCLNLIQYHQ